MSKYLNPFESFLTSIEYTPTALVLLVTSCPLFWKVNMSKHFCVLHYSLLLFDMHTWRVRCNTDILHFVPLTLDKLRLQHLISFGRGIITSSDSVRYIQCSTLWLRLSVFLRGQGWAVDSDLCSIYYIQILWTTALIRHGSVTMGQTQHKQNCFFTFASQHSRIAWQASVKRPWIACISPVRYPASPRNTDTTGLSAGHMQWA